MPTPLIFDQFTEDVAHGVHNLGSDTLKVALTLTAPDTSADAVFADLTEIAAGNGYAAGGYTVATSSSGQSSGLYSLSLGAVNITASGGSMAEWRYAVLYNDTAASDPLIAVWDRGASITLTDGTNSLIEAGIWLQNG